VGRVPGVDELRCPIIVAMDYVADVWFALFFSWFALKRGLHKVRAAAHGPYWELETAP
jgi:hypothetical protein